MCVMVNFVYPSMVEGMKEATRIVSLDTNVIDSDAILEILKRISDRVKCQVDSIMIRNFWKLDDKPKTEEKKVLLTESK